MDMKTQGRRVGALEVRRALESVTPFSRKMFFPDVPDEAWAPHLGWLAPRGYDPKADTLLFPVQSYVVRTSHHTILIDTCVGNHKERPNRPLWHRKTDTAWLDALAAMGLSPADIDYVFCTHLHADHAGWNTKLEDGRWVPTFPKAKYVFSKKELEAWRDVGHPKFSRAVYQDSVLPVVEAGRALLVSGDWELDDEVRLEPTPGHTPDHVAVRFDSRGETAVMCGDLIHSPVQCRHPDWVPWPDWDPALAARTRRDFLERYCGTPALVCTAHFPLPSAGRVVREGNAFKFVDDAARW
ncbi:MAG TPA: MBL fold metallo-hydrolase [Burkholderiales bacterium]|nr:MBL fold metallo-hydrolase [Burkholderiales bacterium]